MEKFLIGGEPLEHPTYEGNDLSIDSSEEMEEARKMAGVTSHYNAMVRAKNIGERTGDGQLAQAAKGEMKEAMEGLPKEVVFDTYWSNNGSPMFLLMRLKHYLDEAGVAPEGEAHQICLVKKEEKPHDHTVSDFRRIGRVLPTADTIGEFYYRGEDDLLKVFLKSLEKVKAQESARYEEYKKNLPEGSEKNYVYQGYPMYLEFLDYAAGKVKQDDLVVDSYETGLDENIKGIVNTKEENLFGLVRDFLKEKGLELSMVVSYEKIPMASESYVLLSDWGKQITGEGRKGTEEILKMLSERTIAEEKL
jgi:hypothetical protein